jgi:carbon monoxide dehydrogenase subunit G
MELIGDVVIEAPRAQVWAALNDPAVLQACIPGCEQVTDESPEVRLVRLMVKMGPVRARFQGRVTLSDVLEPERCVMTFEGSGGAAGMASGRSQVALIEEEGGENGGAVTRLRYTVKASVGGKLGQIGGRMMDASAKQLADQFFSALGAQLAPVPRAAPDAPVAGPVTSVPTAAVPVAAAAPAALHANAGQAVPPASAAVANASLNNELSRLLWFVMGAASTGFGVWLGSRLP